MRNRPGAGSPSLPRAAAGRTARKGGRRASRAASLRTVHVGAAGAGARADAAPGYDVRIGSGALGALTRDLASGRLTQGKIPPRAVVVSDATVARLYGRALARDLERLGLPAALLSFPAGETHKTRDTKTRLEDRLARLGFGRDGVIVALGGGVTGDLAGFVAATWHRGVPVVQAPTTVMGMLDSAIGGKVAVDIPAGKNLVGAFHAPLAVYADTRTLETLPRRELRAGLAEAVKVGAIASAPLFRVLEQDGAAVLRREPAATARVIEAGARVKARIVSSDVREAGPRMLLNFGHTLGHAIESAAGYRLRHGEAVAVGIVLESRLAVHSGLLEAGAAVRIEALVRALGLPVDPPRDLRIGVLLEGASRDKKVRGGVVRYVVPSRIGTHAGGDRYAVTIPLRLVRRVLRGAGLRD